jgi:hypothetical protein
LRETKEEMSLEIDKDWLYHAGPNKNNPRRGLGGNAVNTFYHARPPCTLTEDKHRCSESVDDLLGDLEKEATKAVTASRLTTESIETSVIVCGFTMDSGRVLEPEP